MTFAENNDDIELAVHFVQSMPTNGLSSEIFLKRPNIFLDSKGVVFTFCTLIYLINKWDYENYHLI